MMLIDVARLFQTLFDCEFLDITPAKKPEYVCKSQRISKIIIKKCKHLDVISMQRRVALTISVRRVNAASMKKYFSKQNAAFYAKKL